MKNPITKPFDPDILAVLHRTGKVWRGLVASTRAQKPAVIAWREFTPERLSQFDEWLNEHQAGSVLCVLPAALVICRNCSLPDADPEQLEQALSLQAEAHLLGMAPAHRLAMSVLPGASGETSRNGIVVAWPASAKFDLPPISRPVTYIPDVAALGAVLNGQRPANALLWLDRADGSVALALTHAGGAIFRGTREDAESTEAWQRSVGRIIAETAMSVGHTGPFIQSLMHDAQGKASSLKAGEAALFAPSELIVAAATRAQGLSADPHWWSQYGVAAGALLARTGPLANLTHLQQAPPIEVPSRIKTTLEALSRPRTATAVVVACMVMLMFGPLLASGLRLQILKWRFGNIHQQLAQATASKHQLEMYRELKKQQAWPMTKLLADIANNTPMGIDVESIRIEGGENFTVSGTAFSHGGKTPQEVFAQMQANLRKDGLFSDIVPQWGNANNLGVYKFDLTGGVSDPYANPVYPRDRDFGVYSLARRLYGEPEDEKVVKVAEAPPATRPQLAEASDTGQGGPAESRPDVLASTETGSPDESATLGSGRRPSRRPTIIPGDSDAGSIDDRPEGGPAPSADIPPEVTKEQLEAMELSELRSLWARVSEARQYHKGAEEKKLTARLLRDFELIKAEVNKRTEAARRNKTP